MARTFAPLPSRRRFIRVGSRAGRWVATRILGPFIFVALVVGGCGLGDDGEWTSEEREAVAEFISGLDHLGRGISTLNQAANPGDLSEAQRQEALGHLRRAQALIGEMGDSLLTKIHPQLPVYHRSRLQKGIDDRIRALNGGHGYRFASGITRLREWADWYTRTRDDWNLPRR